MKKIIVLSLILALFTTGCSLTGADSPKILAPEEAKATAVDFINNNLMQPGSEISVKEISEDNNLYKIILNMSSGQEITSYLSRDGKLFFPQVMNIEEVTKETEQNKNQEEANKAAANTDVPKTKKAKVELFVMSHCPYGTQIVKGIIPTIEALGDDVDFELKFCDYAMHGKKELDEQLTQHCIQKNEPEKLFEYLKCFLSEADATEKCLDSVRINRSKLTSCVNSTDAQYKVTELYNDKNTWTSGRFPQYNVNKADANKYGVKGSPGLVVNGVKISSARDSDSLLKTICSGYENAPTGCGAELSSTSPSPGFGYSATGSNTAASCAQ
ncbi:MAG: thioredoxin domain-containing protein [Patescibacteria group bacterium]|nr:thioredoxin domain-containing protein [Patescibacteria group bacterium]